MLETPPILTTHDRSFALQRLRQRAVIGRDERRALPAGGYVGGAKIVHDRDVDRSGQSGGVADLHGQLLRRPVQHGLAVEADDIDILPGDAVLRDEGRDRFGMGLGDGALGLAEDARPRVAPRQIDGLGQRLAQQAALVVGIGAVAGSARTTTRSPSVSIKATSIPSSEVPLIRPIAVSIIAFGLELPPAGSPACVKRTHLIMPQRSPRRRLFRPCSAN